MKEKFLNLLKKIGKGGSYFLKGILIGIAMIIPGVSGGTLAVMLNIYNDLIDAINNLFKHFKTSIKVLLPILFGALIGFNALVVPLEYGLKHCPLIIVSLFVGLIIGSLPSLYRNVKGKISTPSIIWGLISLGIMIGLCFISGGNVTSINIDFPSIIILTLLGFAIACALVTPGISGSMLLMTFGYYEIILTKIHELMKFENISQNILIVLPIGVGAVIGFFVISYIMGILLKKFPVSTYMAIIGFIVGSIGVIYYKTFLDYSVKIDILQISLSIIFLIIGGITSFLIAKTIKKDEQIIEEKEEEVKENGQVD